jgi:hypothetical protein
MITRYIKDKDVYECEHMGITFRYTNEAIVDALRQQHIDLLPLVCDTIEHMVRFSENQGLPLDFSVRIQITRDMANDFYSHGIKISKISRHKD